MEEESEEGKGVASKDDEANKVKTPSTCFVRRKGLKQKCENRELGAGAADESAKDGQGEPEDCIECGEDANHAQMIPQSMVDGERVEGGRSKQEEVGEDDPDEVEAPFPVVPAAVQSPQDDQNGSDEGARELQC